MQTRNYKLEFSGTNIYVGIDAHLRSWTVSVMVESILTKTFSQNPDARDLRNYLENNYPNGSYYSAYEAGFCGFSVHRDLQKNVINNIVANPADIPTTDKEEQQKDDVRDSKK